MGRYTVEYNLNWDEAKEAMYNGCFVAEEWFDGDQSIHMYNGILYLEDGCMILPNSEKEGQIEWMSNDHKFRVIANPDEIDKTKLEEIHKFQKDKGNYMIERFGRSYQEAIIKK